MLDIISKIAFLLMIVMPVQAQTESWKLMHQGDKNFMNGNFKEAEKCYDNALQLDTTNARARFNLADTYLAQGIADRAQHEYERLARESINNEKNLSSKAFHNMGVIRQSAANSTQDENQKQNFLRQAISDYKSALRLNPNAEDSRYNLVMCQKQLKEMPQNQNDQQKDNQSKNKSEQKDKSEDKKQQQKPQPKDKQEPPKEQKRDQQTEQILNYARQKEQKTKDKINVMPQKRNRGKNW